MFAFNYDASTNAITADRFASFMPSLESRFLILYCHGESCSFCGSIQSISLLLSSSKNRDTLQAIAERYGRPNALADLDAFIYSYIWGV